MNLQTRDKGPNTITDLVTITSRMVVAITTINSRLTNCSRRELPRSSNLRPQSLVKLTSQSTSRRYASTTCKGSVRRATVVLFFMRILRRKNLFVDSSRRMEHATEKAVCIDTPTYQRSTVLVLISISAPGKINSINPMMNVRNISVASV